MAAFASSVLGRATTHNIALLSSLGVPCVGDGRGECIVFVLRTEQNLLHRYDNTWWMLIIIDREVTNKIHIYRYVDLAIKRKLHVCNVLQY